MVRLYGGLVPVFSFVVSCSLALSYPEDTLRDAKIQFNDSVSGILSLLPRELSSKCRRDITALKNGLVSHELWAVQMIDSASKLQSGLLEGNIRDLGMYDECVGIQPEQNSANIQGRHCMFSVMSSAFSDANFINDYWKMNMTGNKHIVGERNKEFLALVIHDPMSSICVPSTCDSNDVLQMLNTMFERIPIINAFGLNVTTVVCSKETREDMDMGEILTIALLGIIATLIISCTLCDLLLRKEVIGASGPLTLISQFSILKSMAAVFNTQISPGTMPAIHGIRFLSIVWILIAHRFLIQLTRPLTNLREALSWPSTWNSVLVISAPLAVDTCFVISGCLMTYLYLNALRSGRKINVPMLYLHRYLRLTPAVVVMILFTAYLLPKMGSGALYDPTMSILSDGCKDDWWRFLLYIQNYGHTKPCMLHTWYLANDMQLFWISPLILYPLHRWPKWGLALLWLLIVASIVMPATILGVNRYSNVLSVTVDSIERSIDQFEDWYIPTHYRATPYFIGIFLGFIMATKAMKFSKEQVRINWLITCCLLLACAINQHLLFKNTYVYNIYREIISNILTRLCWSIGISWIIYACTHGYGGPVTRFLSLPLFLPLSRLSYCAYLISLQFQVANSFTARTALYVTNYSTFVEFWAEVFFTIQLSIVLAAFVESPIIVLEKLMRGTGGKREKAEDSPPSQPVDESPERTAESQA